MKRYCLIGSMIPFGKTMLESNSLDKLRELGATLRDYAIYRSYHPVTGRSFHNATDEDFLVEYANSTYWLNIHGQRYCANYDRCEYKGRHCKWCK